ncbi:inovirus Gp2 family protein [Vibrio parahaemolyticus]|uniref:inovirus Gp2 family protein n=1 Tax=Vibrio parahaemolyticus TaxID=670 RepID=UPI001FADC183|nr:inovirus Gp2 family protein [Vibrio parahaemolyticus]MCI9689787.1 inovirus Gp2 family protein [Vibrio parahaemolyticus]
MSYSNKKLTILNQSMFNGHEVVSGYNLCVEYLDSIYQLMDRALAEHPRTTVLRFDLRLPKCVSCPDYPYEHDTSVITRFIESFKAQVRADLAKKKREGKRVHHCTIRYVWAKEINEANQPHYHVALLLNKDTYYGFGDYRTLSENLAGKIYRAWASALMYGDTEEVMGLVHIPSDTPCYYLDRNSLDYQQQCNNVFRRLSYLAKVETKQYGRCSKNFCCSRK